MIHLIFCIFLFLLGASFGSFLNVVVWRLPRWGFSSLASPPSHCPKCEHRLAWKDNIPVLGWFLLRGRSLGQAEAGSNENHEQARALHGCYLRAEIPSRLLKNCVAAALRRHHTRKTLRFWRDKPAATTR